MKPASMRLVFLVAAAAVALLWVLFYVYFLRLDCQIRAPQGDCAPLMPWQLKGGPFYLLIALPASIVAFLLLLAWFTGRTPPEGDDAG